jgi:stage V sporulation protein G
VEITEVRVRLAERKRDRLRAFCSITFEDAFVVRDVKVIQGNEGLFVAMPSRKLTDRCPSCGNKNQLRSRYCSECGSALAEDRAELDDRGRPRLYVDIAHPINAEARDAIERSVLEAYREELERAEEPGYQARSFRDDLEDDDYQDVEEERPRRETRPEPPERPSPGGDREPPRPSPEKPREKGRGFGAGIFDEDET